jgi:hypothetical protein
MSPETLLLDRIEEKGAAPSRKSTEPMSEDAVDLTEDTTPPRVGHQPWTLVRQASDLAEGETNDKSGSAVRIVFDERPHVGRSGTSLRASLEALSELRADAQTIDWLEVAVVLKRDVARLHDSNFSRHAAVLLALADALTFTDPAEVSAVEGRETLRHALGLLSEPYISEASEEEFLGELLMAGWNLAPSEEQALELVD